MSWTQVSFGTHKGMTLPQIMFKDPDWFFYGCEKGYFKNGLLYEAYTVYSRSRSIRVPQQPGVRMVAHYVIDKPTGKFGTLQIIAEGPGQQHMITRPVIDFFIPRAYGEYDKLGYSTFITKLKAIVFGNRSRYMTKSVCEDFFDDDTNFDLNYANRNYPMPSDLLMTI